MVNRDWVQLAELYKRMGFIPTDVDTAPIVVALENALPDVRIMFISMIVMRMMIVVIIMIVMRMMVVMIIMMMIVMIVMMLVQCLFSCCS